MARLLITPKAGRFSDRAMSDPAKANMTPIEGNTRLSQTAPKLWYATTRANASARSVSR
ncbi:MAG: hypothetical protein NVS3B6_00020 [Pseudarthrobacter sp.]